MRRRFGWVWAGLLGCSGCIMGGYDRAPLDRDVNAPAAGDGAGSGAGSSGTSGGSAGSAGSAGKGGLVGSPDGGAGSGAGSGGGTAGSAGSGASGTGGSAGLVVDICGTAAGGTACNDGRRCTEGDVCFAGYCVGRPHCAPNLNTCSPVVCDEATLACNEQAVPDLVPCNALTDSLCISGLCGSLKTCTTATCDLECETACVYHCPGAALCNPICDAKVACYFDCSGAQQCSPICESESVCKIDCQGVDDCLAHCKAGSRCLIDCRGGAGCDEVVCDDGAECALTCDGTKGCGFVDCAAGEQSCPGGRIGCGGCPE